MLAFQEWREMFQRGELNEVQSQFFRTRPAESLYDIANDPHETTDLSSDPKYFSVLKQMRDRLNERLLSMPDLSLIPESVLYDEAMENPVAYGRQNQARIARALDVGYTPRSDTVADRGSVGAAIGAF